MSDISFFWYPENFEIYQRHYDNQHRIVSNVFQNTADVIGSPAVIPILQEMIPNGALNVSRSVEETLQRHHEFWSSINNSGEMLSPDALHELNQLKSNVQKITNTNSSIVDELGESIKEESGLESIAALIVISVTTTFDRMIRESNENFNVIPPIIFAEINKTQLPKSPLLDYVKQCIPEYEELALLFEKKGNDHNNDGPGM